MGENEGIIKRSKWPKKQQLPPGSSLPMSPVFQTFLQRPPNSNGNWQRSLPGNALNHVPDTSHNHHFLSMIKFNNSTELIVCLREIQMKAERCEVWWWCGTQHTFNSYLSLIMMKIQTRKKNSVCWRRSSLTSHFRLNVQYLLGNCLTYTRICLCRSRWGPPLWHDWETWVRLCAHLMLRLWIHTYIFVGVVFFFKTCLYIMFEYMSVPHMSACCLTETII